MADMDLSRVFGRVLREARQTAGLSQERLAHDCGLDRTFISLMERGHRQPSLETIFLLARGLQIMPSLLIQAVEDQMSFRKRR